MLPLIVLLFVVVPIVELAVILQVGDWLGLWPTLALLVADSILGALLMRSQGRAAWQRFSEQVRAGRPPAREVIDGALILVGSALLLTPGFVTDAVGLSLLLPPTRALIRAAVVRRFLARMTASMTRPRRGHDVEGTATDVGGPGDAPRPTDLGDPRAR